MRSQSACESKHYASVCHPTAAFSTTRSGLSNEVINSDGANCFPLRPHSTRLCQHFARVCVNVSRARFKSVRRALVLRVWTYGHGPMAIARCFLFVFFSLSLSLVQCLRIRVHQSVGVGVSVMLSAQNPRRNLCAHRKPHQPRALAKLCL